MNIEVYKETGKSKKIERSKEEKEAREKEVKLTRELCSDYHRDLDSTTYFDDKAMKKAKDLLPKFKALNLKSLPQALQNVVKHRTAYLQLMVDLSGNNKFSKVIGEFAPNVAIKEKAAKSATFKTLNLDDFKEALAALRRANKSLKDVLNPKHGSWDKVAKRFLMPPGERGKKDSRVDDLKAAQNLQSGIDKLIKNISRLSREKEVLKQGKS